jgi:acylpyruvate hydrolase
MRLVAIEAVDGHVALHGLVGDRVVPLAEHVADTAAAGQPLADVGDLYVLGPTAVAAVRSRLAALGKEPNGSLPLPDRLAAPVGRRGKLICVGLNYRAHAIESGLAIPERPVLFAKYPNTVVGHGASVVHHRITDRLDYEVELGVVIGARAARVPVSSAMDVVAGYTVVNDVSGRDLQFGDVQWLRGKSLDTWAPIGPVFVTADEVADPHDLAIGTTVNGEVRQASTTADMIFRIPELVAFISEAITLEPGDVIATGTPQGVGMGFFPPRYLKDGDVVDVTVQGIGTLRSHIVAPSDD